MDEGSTRRLLIVHQEARYANSYNTGKSDLEALERD